MCRDIACSFSMPLPQAQRINAGYRLLAARADEERAFAILSNLGFKGLVLKSNGEGIIRYKYKSYDEPRLNHLMGAPKADIKAPNIRYPYGVHGLLAVWPGKSEVLLRNTSKGKDSIELPEALENVPHIPHAPVAPVQTPRTGTENDDGHVPVTHLPDNLVRDYTRCQTQAKYRVKFMQDLWIYMNHAKFQGRLRQPHLVLMKGSTASKMKARGYWFPSTRELKIHPQVFNTTQNFFVEIFLHEMCHEAVSEEWQNLTTEQRKDNEKHMGHGTVWAKWMVHVGLNPRRFDPNENTTYMSNEEKSENDKRLAQWKESADAAQALGLGLLSNPRLGSPVIVRRMDGLRRGYMVCLVVKARQEWAVLSQDEYENYDPQKNVSWYLSRLSTVYDNPEGRDLAMDHKFLDAAHRIIRFYQAKKDKAAATREYNKMRKSDDYY